MRHGKVVEEGPASQLFKNPKSDYTLALFAAAFGLEAQPGGTAVTWRMKSGAWCPTWKLPGSFAAPNSTHIAQLLWRDNSGRDTDVTFLQRLTYLRHQAGLLSSEVSSISSA
ncbi:hypothetical protein [Bradyrhizobium sp.]|uniref:hypothetical protein n=1 Tax=Bradyrhizobium sp. TaxID=376 RepID=UPI0025BF9162|nr:hypothetical protein [Bradyrhizobium sp.]